MGIQDPNKQPAEPVLPKTIIKPDPDGNKEEEIDTKAGILLEFNEEPSEEDQNFNEYLDNTHWNEDTLQEANDALDEDDPLPLVQRFRGESSKASNEDLKDKLQRFVSRHPKKSAAIANCTP